MNPKIVEIQFPSSIENFQVLQTLDNGSSKPQQIQIDSSLFVLKFGANPEQLESEVAVNTAYRAAGILVPASKLYESADGKRTMLGQWIQGETWRCFKENQPFSQVEIVRKKLHQGFILDCLFGNWDVVGKKARLTT